MHALLQKILNQSKSKHSVRLVLLVIAHYSKGKGADYGFVADDEFIAEKAKIHIRNLKIILENLEKSGHLKMKHPGSLTCYKIQKSAYGE